MRTTCLYLLLVLTPLYLRSQSYQGYRTSNYQGVTSVFFNPANIADNRYKWDINIFSADGYAGNNQEGLNFGDVFDASFNIDTLKSILLSGTGPGLRALGRLDIFGPSGMLDIKGNISLALITRSRIFSNARQIDGRLVNAVIDGSPTSADYPFGFNMESSLIHSVGWNEIGIAAARSLSKKQSRHFFKTGLTIKYLAGLADTYLRMQNFTGTADYGNRGTYLTNTTGNIKLNTTAANFVGFNFGDLFRFNGNGIGADLGFIYEFRPRQDFSQYKDDRFANKYKFKVGVALMDLGRIRFNKSGNQSATYDVNIPADQQYTLSRFKTRSVKDYKQFFDRSPHFTSIQDNSNPYTITLPAVFQGDADYHIKDEYYINLSGQLDLNTSDGLNLFAFNSLSLTPRFENEKYSFSIPLNYNEISQFNAGASFRIGRFSIGSGSLFTAIFGSKQADFHIGFHYGFAHPKTKRPDRDKDGIYDDIDTCPLDSGVARYGGCPVPDTDNDGIVDDKDSCVTVPGLEKYHGCPIPDSDKDGINDEKDQCPDLPGTADNNGCPKEKEIPEHERDLDDMDTLTVHFSTASANLSPREIQDVLVAVRRLNDRWPGTAFYIDGYTDNTGTIAINKRLSRARALFVAKIFRTAGIEPYRIIVRSFAMDNPRCDNDSESGRACNRRVEIKRKD